MPNHHSNSIEIAIDLLISKWKYKLTKTDVDLPNNSNEFNQIIEGILSEIDRDKIQSIPALMGCEGVLPREMSLVGIKSSSSYDHKSVEEFLTIFEKIYFNLLFKSLFKYDWCLLYDKRKYSQEIVKINLLLNGLGGKTITECQSLDYRGIGIVTPNNKKIAHLALWLESYFKIPIKLEYAVPQTVLLEHESLTKLGLINHVLGVDSLLGKYGFQYADRVNVIINIETEKQYSEWLNDPQRIKLIYQTSNFYFKMNVQINIKMNISSVLIEKSYKNNRVRQKRQLAVNCFLGLINKQKVQISL